MKTSRRKTGYSNILALPAAYKNGRLQYNNNNNVDDKVKGGGIGRDGGKGRGRGRPGRVLSGGKGERGQGGRGSGDVELTDDRNKPQSSSRSSRALNSKSHHELNGKGGKRVVVHGVRRVWGTVKSASPICC